MPGWPLKVATGTCYHALQVAHIHTLAGHALSPCTRAMRILEEGLMNQPGIVRFAGDQANGSGGAQAMA